MTAAIWVLCVVLDHRSGEACVPFEQPMTKQQCEQAQRQWAVEALGWSIRSGLAWDRPMSMCLPPEGYEEPEGTPRRREDVPVMRSICRRSSEGPA